MSITKDQTELGGMLGERITVRKVSNRVVVANRPKRKLKARSEKQEAFLEKFISAARYAKQLRTDADAMALYEKGITEKKKSAFVVALTDYIKAPVVSLIDPANYDGNVGSTILVKASDDFMVTRVKVAIFNAAGSRIEEGEAVQDLINEKLWSYKATVANPTPAGCSIEARAFDRPGNVGTLSLVL